MRRHIPNQLTLLRLVFATGFFIVISQYRYPRVYENPLGGVIAAAIVLFILAAITDALDGYLARRWQVESTFGRIMDPFCDKVLILGAFIFLAGPRFVIPDQDLDRGLIAVHSASGIYPWMVVVILARELLVTSMRGVIEGRGGDFRAVWAGKWKMILQSITIPVVLLLVWINPIEHEWARWVRDILVYATVAVTIISVLPYIASARIALVDDKENLKEMQANSQDEKAESD